MGYDEEDDDDFDYDDFVEREFGTPLRSKEVPIYWQVTAIFLVLLFLISIWGGLGFWTPF